MTTPRTVAGQAALSAMRPHVKRALAQVILSIEDEAIAPYLGALHDADLVLEALAARDAAATWDTADDAGLIARAEAAHRRIRALIAVQAG